MILDSELTTAALETMGIIPRLKGNVIPNLALYTSLMMKYTFLDVQKTDLLHPCSENDLKMCSIKRGSNPERREPSGAQKTDPTHDRQAEGRRPQGTAGPQQARESGRVLRKRAFS